MPPLPFFTIGHSTRSIDEFAALLREADVGVVVDVRSMPRSRTNPQFNADTFAAQLADRQVSYVRIPELGGLRGRRWSLETSPNTYWRVRGFRNYADYALSEAFHGGLAQLLQLGRDRRAAIMCAEAVWWRCHRRIIADYLLIGGETVFHILGGGHIEPAKLTPGGRATVGGKIFYNGADDPGPCC